MELPDPMQSAEPILGATHGVVGGHGVDAAAKGICEAHGSPEHLLVMAAALKRPILSESVKVPES